MKELSSFMYKRLCLLCFEEEILQYERFCKKCWNKIIKNMYINEIKK